MNKNISKFISESACSHKKLMILFSKLSGYANISNEIIKEEIQNAKGATLYIENKFIKICNYKFEIPAIEINYFDIEESKHFLLEHIDNIEGEKIYINLDGKTCKNCVVIGSLKQEGPNGNIICMNCKTCYEAEELLRDFRTIDLESNNPVEYTNDDYEVGDIVDCTLKSKRKFGYIVSFGMLEGFIHLNNLSAEI